MPGGTWSWESVCYGNGKFVAVCEGIVISAYSTDGINWIQATMPGTQKWHSVCYGDGKFVSIAINGNAVAYVKDYFNSWA